MQLVPILEVFGWFFSGSVAQAFLQASSGIDAGTSKLSLLKGARDIVTRLSRAWSAPCLFIYVIAKLTFTCLLGPLTIQEMHCVVAFPLPSFDHGFCGRSFSPLAPFRVLLISLALVTAAS